MTYLLYLVNKYDKSMKEHFVYMAKEDSLNIHQFDDLDYESEKLKRLCRKIQLEFLREHSIDVLKQRNNSFYQRIQRAFTLSVF